MTQNVFFCLVSSLLNPKSQHLGTKEVYKSLR
jgi:hypothetical protein